MWASGHGLFPSCPGGKLSDCTTWRGWAGYRPLWPATGLVPPGREVCELTGAVAEPRELETLPESCPHMEVPTRPRLPVLDAEAWGTGLGGQSIRLWPPHWTQALMAAVCCDPRSRFLTRGRVQPLAVSHRLSCPSAFSHGMTKSESPCS